MTRHGRRAWRLAALGLIVPLFGAGCVTRANTPTSLSRLGPLAPNATGGAATGGAATSGAATNKGGPGPGVTAGTGRGPSPPSPLPISPPNGSPDTLIGGGSPPENVPVSTFVVSPIAGPVTVLSSPGGPAIGTLPLDTFGVPTWVPVLASQAGWDQIELPGPPNGLSGWIAASSVAVASTPYLLVVSLSAGRLTVYEGGHLVAVAPAAVGAPATPTPPGRTYVAGDVAATGVDAELAPLVRPLGWHSTIPSAVTEFPGGVVAIHGWRDEQVDPALWDGARGQVVSHGCIRVPADVLTRVLGLVPNGTPVWIEA